MAKNSSRYRAGTGVGMNSVLGAGYGQQAVPTISREGDRVNNRDDHLEAQSQRRRRGVEWRIKELLGVLAPTLVTTLRRTQDAIYEAMESNGFWAAPQDNTAGKIALIHSELSEALEADRKNVEYDDKVPEFTGLEAELADAMIRILDLAGRHDMRLGEALMAKMEYNLTRPHKHGKAY